MQIGIDLGATKIEFVLLDNDNIEYEVEQYKNNFIEEVGTQGFIWKMHNWSDQNLAGDPRFRLRKAPELYLMLSRLLKEFNGDRKQFLKINLFNQQLSQNWSRISQSPRSCPIPRMVG